jgi:ribosomal protein S18 acetylase RimI-like enzyme
MIGERNATVVTRPATAADVPAISACARAAYEKYLPRMDREPAPMIADFAAHVAAGEVHVLVEDGALLGYIVAMARADCWFVDNVAVAPEHQGRSLGRRLMDLAEAAARERGLGEVRLYTNVVMTENIGFYGRLGFVETERVREHGFDRVYMAKRLEQTDERETS